MASSIHDIRGMRHYHGWSYEYDQTRRVRERWRGTRTVRGKALIVLSHSEIGLRQQMDAQNEKLSEREAA